MSFHHIFETAFGFCGIAWNEHGICRFMLPMSAPGPAEGRMVGRLSSSCAAEPAGFAAEGVAAARRYFDGGREDFSAFPVDLDGVDPFRHAIYQAARRLGYGETTTYGGLAADAGFPQTARETGVALGRNPVPLIVPCHRILAAGGRLGGFSAPGGTATKQKMLALENATSPDVVPAQASFAF
ncbi:methylated-DNA--[protein]-cysteine S-methyltransferase [Chelativorans sp. AA-79]|uniref:methylated-DNA--[protein]-cysteine S-methyltransferase n=1 Tax=Chelativorans sp. AA-79 TaxID=3028735 RepID=UPI0023F71577|nr:methylated-DNA--[protein]-cysteine S-methyltransferase [Chelativorans sp. AA-79]WEX11205.1 methylated-DNA--[protein]-cysteine S-methyltransferase [Chelativorans sp. AA-79]